MSKRFFRESEVVYSQVDLCLLFKTRSQSSHVHKSTMETALRSDYSNPDAENPFYDLEEKGLRIVARSGQLVVKPKKAIPAEVSPLIQ